MEPTPDGAAPMRHPEAHERLTDLALEPAALDRLVREVAGDVSVAPADGPFVEHVASCEACRLELQAASCVTRGLERALAGLPAGSTPEPIEPPASLRAAVLAATGGTRAVSGAVATAGRAAADREAAALEAADRAAASRAAAATATGSRSLRERLADIEKSWRRLAAPARFASAIAALLVVAVIGGAVGLELGRTPGEPSGDSLAATVATIDRVLAAPDHRIVPLVDPAGTSVGSVAWTHEDFTVLTSSLPSPANGLVYRCWLVWAGRSDLVGQMDFAGSVAYWTGAAGSWSNLTYESGTRFEVTLEPRAVPSGPAPAGPIVLQADLGA